MTRISKSLLFGLALLLATQVFAAEKASLTTYNAVTVGGKQLKPGDYNLRWDGAGPTVQLNVLRGKTVVLTVPAKMVDSPQEVDRTTYSYTTNPDGTKSLSRVQLKGKKSALEIGGATTTDAMGSTN